MVEDVNLAKELIAKRAARELTDGQLVNLGIGIPTLVANYQPEGVRVILQSEGGITAMWTKAKPDAIDMNYFDASGGFIAVQPGAACFDSLTSFAIIRGGHIDLTILGALEVDQEGNLASWIIPGKMVHGIGGAMDLVAGSKNMIVTMLHTEKGESKILKKCRLPLTGKGMVKMIITELCVMKVTDKGLVVTEIFDNSSKEEVIRLTEAELIFQ